MPSRYTGFSELTEFEAAIGKRVRAARKQVRLSQSKLAPVIGLTRDQLNNVEIGRVGLRFGPGWSVCAELDINPLWLAFGSTEAPEKDGFLDLSGGIDAVAGDKLFSTVMEDLQGSDEEWPGYAHFRATSLRHKQRKRSEFAKQQALEEWFAAIPFDEDEDFWRIVRRFAAIYARSRNDSVKRGLTIRSTSINVASMKSKGPLWPPLRERIRRLVRGYGAKSMLARQVGLSRQAINALLSTCRGKPYLPSAEYTLRLLDWVTAEEAKSKQKKRAGSAETRPALKTRKSKSTTNESKKSGQKTK